MVKHIVLYTFKEGVDKAEAVQIVASVLEGLSFGAGDAVIGLNPAGDTAESAKQIAERNATIIW